jgi:hypothetical protein
MATTHAKVSATADGADATLVLPSDWNAEHVGIIDTQAQPATDQTVRANSYARIGGMPLVIASGSAVILASGALLELAP